MSKKCATPFIGNTFCSSFVPSLNQPLVNSLQRKFVCQRNAKRIFKALYALTMLLWKCGVVDPQHHTITPCLKLLCTTHFQAWHLFLRDPKMCTMDYFPPACFISISLSFTHPIHWMHEKYEIQDCILKIIRSLFGVFLVTGLFGEGQPPTSCQPSFAEGCIGPKPNKNNTPNFHITSEAGCIPLQNNSPKKENPKTRPPQNKIPHWDFWKKSKR